MNKETMSRPRRFGSGPSQSLRKRLGWSIPATAERLNDLAELYFAQGRYTQAQFLCQRALSICEKTLGPEHPDTIAYREHLTRIVSKREGSRMNGHHPPAPPRC